MSNIDLLKNIWESVYDPRNDVSTVIKQYFHPNYTQCINGVEMSYDDYISHVKEQKQNMQINKIDYKHVLEDGDEVFALYYPRGTNNEGLLVEAEVIAYFRFEEQKLNRIHGQVRLIVGNLSDVDM
ncbi:nuclear transport factor 2 family protein [Legionella bononiensis]|uniref:Nuclear transport factor 2 family protein n=1 Tax=Legionella bononiensis TaxID=2793102 RepID=A0ABS1WDK1_9GAMM|nr:nuclear transport factor 2 family protein [Legionella bononiensis]MBL7481403.1 nuclear transport factor 2 family protein [Legionella bononiensis]MBL7527435.1 nuclear transport factor 2 family protein [Legionella bononiensis]